MLTIRFINYLHLDVILYYLHTGIAYIVYISYIQILIKRYKFSYNFKVVLRKF